MKTIKKILQPVEIVESCKCDKCERVITNGEDEILEFQEMLHIEMVGGPGSIFRDGTLIEGDFCQNCVNELLGKFLRYEHQ